MCLKVFIFHQMTEKKCSANCSHNAFKCLKSATIDGLVNDYCTHLAGSGSRVHSFCLMETVRYLFRSDASRVGAIVAWYTSPNRKKLCCENTKSIAYMLQSLPEYAFMAIVRLMLEFTEANWFQSSALELCSIPESLENRLELAKLVSLKAEHMNCLSNVRIDESKSVTISEYVAAQTKHQAIVFARDVNHLLNSDRVPTDVKLTLQSKFVSPTGK